MSRAFTSENDGWLYCQEKREECMFADEAGKCLLSQCRYDKKKETNTDAEGKEK